MDDLDIALAGAFAFGLLVCIVCVVVHEVRKGPRNRRTGLPAPRPDERSSIEQFKRIHSV
jgi:hypothetical protein